MVEGLWLLGRVATVVCDETVIVWRDVVIDVMLFIWWGMGWHHH